MTASQCLSNSNEPFLPPLDPPKTQGLIMTVSMSDNPQKRGENEQVKVGLFYSSTFYLFLQPFFLWGGGSTSVYFTYRVFGG